MTAHPIGIIRTDNDLKTRAKTTMLPRGAGVAVESSRTSRRIRNFRPSCRFFWPYPDTFFMTQESFGNPFTTPCADLGTFGLARVRPPAHQPANGRPPLSRRPSPGRPPPWRTLSKDRMSPPKNFRTLPGRRQASVPKSNAAQRCALPPPPQLNRRHRSKQSTTDFPTLAPATSKLASKPNQSAWSGGPPGAPSARKMPAYDSNSLHEPLNSQHKRPKLTPSKPNCELLKRSSREPSPSHRVCPPQSPPPVTWMFRPPKEALASAADQTPPLHLSIFLKSHPSKPAPPHPLPPDPRKHRSRRHLFLLLLIMADRSNVAHDQVAHHPLPHPVTAVLTRRTLMVNRVDLPFPTVHHVFLEVIPQRHLSLVALLRAAAARAAKSPLLVLGHFNVRHPDWGYVKADGPGTRLWQLAHDLRLSLLTDPTRIGNSVCRDTTPDLSFCRYVHDARWSNTHQSLGSDRYIFAIQVRTSPCKTHPHTTRYTDWDAFRAYRLHSAAPDIEDLSMWTNQLLADLNGVTASIPTTEDHLAIDSRLAHLLAARTGLTNLGLLAILASPPPPPRPCFHQVGRSAAITTRCPGLPRRHSVADSRPGRQIPPAATPGHLFCPSRVLLRGPQPRTGH
ncbi:hypothetical protein HPB49_010404 [Dermacentor silvarum]|uniref:Uncharacterized protein n=1 Tax=Dermacentor silvarum TaxID=543639 RepID=A0ACB8C302_DERSI|nr:hypothetical protein HPB49_010404 [Dermacentor silvarum]